MYERTPIRLKADFPTETFQARRKWDEIFYLLKENNCQQNIYVCFFLKQVNF